MTCSDRLGMLPAELWISLLMTSGTDSAPWTYPIANAPSRQDPKPNILVNRDNLRKAEGSVIKVCEKHGLQRELSVGIPGDLDLRAIPTDLVLRRIHPALFVVRRISR